MALRASMSVPGVLAPIKYKDKLLVDGGIINNLPLDVARRMGADIVVAVDIGSEKLKKEELKNALKALEQLSFFW